MAPRSSRQIKGSGIITSGSRGAGDDDDDDDGLSPPEHKKSGSYIRIGIVACERQFAEMKMDLR